MWLSNTINCRYFSLQLKVLAGSKGIVTYVSDQEAQTPPLQMLIEMWSWHM